MKKNLLLSIFFAFCSCKNDITKKKNKKAVLLVNHGSKSKTWRDILQGLEYSTKQEILKDTTIKDVRTAFMEYTEPSVASQMKQFDKEGYSNVIVVPIFLTISSHTANDIPNILGMSNNPETRKELEKENIEVYSPKAKVTITPLLDYPNILKKNVLNRVKNLSKNTKEEGVILVAYGDREYNEKWEQLVENIGKYLKNELGIDAISYSWCGHPVRFSSEPTQKAIEEMLKKKNKAIVIPVLVSNDENFQGKIIQKAVDNVNRPNDIYYKQDAILPDGNISNWIINISKETSKNI